MYTKYKTPEEKFEHRRNLSRSEELSMLNKKLLPEITSDVVHSVSDHRKDKLQWEVEQGLYREQGAAPVLSNNYPNFYQEPDFTRSTQAGVVTTNSRGLFKSAQSVFNGSTGAGVGMGSGSGWQGSNNTARQVPEVYSPLWLNSNLNLPRDRATINAWSRSFFALNPIVHNSISLHSTYPISKLNIKSKNRKVEKFFSQMIEEIDLMNICVQIAQEFWILGEAFIYAELDESKAKWTRLLIQNPDYITVSRSVIAGEPVISLRPDENLRRIVNSQRPDDIEQKRQLDPAIIEYVKRNQNIPLNNMFVSHLARRISPYEIRGTGLLVSCFRDLMLFDKLRECYSAEDCEVLTKDGFRKIDEITEISEEVCPNPNYVNGIQLDDNGQISGVLKLKDGVEVACFNPKNESIEYHIPDELHMSKYNGKMLHFHGKKVDCLVTPNHKMLTKQKVKEGYGDWEKVSASKMLEKKTWWKFRSHAKWNGDTIDSVNVCDREIPADLYLKFLGYIISEGCVYRNESHYDQVVSLSQLTNSPFYDDMRKTASDVSKLLNRKCSHTVAITGAGYSKGKEKEKWEGRVHGKGLVQYLFDEIGDGESANSHNKKVPRWVLDLCPEQLNVFLQALMAGDGSESASKYGTGAKSFRYSTVSKQLADDVYEIVFKLGYAPNICVSTGKKSDGRVVTEYIVLWSNTEYGQEPNIYTGDSISGGGSVDEVDYDGVVWCLSVPTGLFITRHNGKITIQGNSKYVQSDNMINPLTLIKIGNGEFRPTPVDLEAWRNVFEECHDEETEVLTDHGFMKFDEAIEISNLLEATSGSVSKTISRPKSGIKIACFNPETECLEYHEPSESHVYDYSGEMYHFHNDKMDIKVTPNHKMWVQSKKFKGCGKQRTSYWGEWDKVLAKDIKPFDRRFRSKLEWAGNDLTEFVTVAGKKVPIELYLEYLGYVISEGCLYTNGKNQHTVGLTQTITRKYGQDNSYKYEKMSSCMKEFCKCIGKSYSDRIVDRKDCGKEVIWNGVLSGWDVFKHFIEEVHTNGKYKSKDKKIPRWVLNLSPRLLNILLNALVLGDGGKQSKNGRFYYTASQHLADDVYEAAYKAGFVPTMFQRNGMFTVQWSETNKGEFPLVNKYSVNPRTKQKKEIISKTKYDGKVWCFTVPTGLFITRRNGKITIQGNSQYDKDFKIFTHDAVNVERVGWGQGIYDISGDITQIIKEIYIGLMVPSVIMDGSDTTYGNGSVALDVLRQRYMQFRNMISAWLKRKIFAPISKLNEFYEYIDGEKTLIVPEIDWNHMSLFDMNDYINSLSQLVQGQGVDKKVSLQTLYRSLGLEYEEEQRKLRYEDIQDAIRVKEQASLVRYSLSELRSLGPDDEIQEIAEPPVPGESPFVDVPGQQPGAPGMGPPGGGLGLPPPPGGGLGLPPPPGGGPKPPGGPPGGGKPPGGAPPPPA